MSAQTCIITGGSSGIGLATAKRFVRQGGSVLITGRSTKKLVTAAEEVAAAQAGVQILTRSVDVAEAGDVQDAVEYAQLKLGRIDVLVNNAGIAPNVAVDQMSDAQFSSTIATNITGVFNFVRAVWPAMLAADGGTIINISSQAAVSPFPGFSVYGGTKAFVDLFTKAIADEGKPHGINAFSIRPGAVDTPLLRELFPDFPPDQTVTAEEVAEVIWQVAQPEMRFSAGDPISVKR